MKKLAVAVYLIVMFIVAIITPEYVEESYYAPATIIETHENAVVMDVDMPDGSIHVFAAGTADGRMYKKGERVRLELASNGTPEYTDDAVMHLYK